MGIHTEVGTHGVSVVGIGTDAADDRCVIMNYCRIEIVRPGSTYDAILSVIIMVVYGKL